MAPPIMLTRMDDITLSAYDHPYQKSTRQPLLQCRINTDLHYKQKVNRCNKQHDCKCVKRKQDNDYAAPFVLLIHPFPKSSKPQFDRQQAFRESQ